MSLIVTMCSPRLAKKLPLCKLYPDSKIIGGSKTKKKVVGENDSTFESSSFGNNFMIAPTKPPRNTIARLSGI